MRRLLLSVIACALMVSGCSAAVPGEPAPADATPTGLVLPPRPRDVSLDGVDPCALLTAEQRLSLGLDGEPRNYTETAPLFRGPACGISGFEPDYISLGIALAVDNGIGAITGPTATGTLTPITVVAFPATLARNAVHPETCAVDIDVNPDQFLEMAFTSSGTRPSVPQDELCRRATVAATAALTALFAS